MYMLIYRESRANQANLKWDFEAGTYGKPRSATYSHRPPGFCEDPPSLNAKCTMAMSWISYWCLIWNGTFSAGMACVLGVAETWFVDALGATLKSNISEIPCDRSFTRLSPWWNLPKIGKCNKTGQKLLSEGLRLQQKIGPINIWINSGSRIL